MLICKKERKKESENMPLSSARYHLTQVFKRIRHEPMAERVLRKQHFDFNCGYKFVPSHENENLRQ